MSGKINGRVIVDNSIGPEKLSEEYLVVSDGGAIKGNLTVEGNLTVGGGANLSETTNYKGSEILNQEDLNSLNARIDETNAVVNTKLSIEDANAALAKKQNNLIAGENIQIASDGVTISSSTKIAESDRILTYDAAGLKSNISVEVDGNEITFYGKNGPDGEPYVLAEFNVLQSQIIEDVYIDDATKELVITFVVDGDPGTETVRVDLTDFIDVYEGTEYIDITGQDISLKYEELRDQLINDGMALQGDLPTNYVTTDSSQTVNGAKTFNNTFTTSNIVPRGTGYSVGNSDNYYLSGFIDGITTSNISVRASSSGDSRIGSTSIPFTNGYISTIIARYIRSESGTSAIGEEGNPFEYIHAGSGIINALNPRNAVGTVGTSVLPYNEGHFKNLQKNGVDVATVDDLVDLDGVVQTTGDQEISGVKTFNGVPVFNAGSATFKTPLLSGGSISAGDNKLVSDVEFEAPNLAYDSDVVKLTGVQKIAGVKSFSDTISTSNVAPASNDVYNIGNNSAKYAACYVGVGRFDSLILDGIQFSPNVYVTTNTTQSIGALKTFQDGIRVAGRISPTSTNVECGSESYPFANGYFSNLYQGGVKVATVKDIPDTSVYALKDTVDNFISAYQTSKSSSGYFDSYNIRSHRFSPLSIDASVGTMSDPFSVGYFSKLFVNGVDITPSRSFTKAQTASSELVSNPSILNLNENTDIRYTNTERKTGTLKISGGVDGKEYRYSILNEAENDLSLTLPDGTKWVIPSGDVGILKIYYLFDRYIFRVV